MKLILITGSSKGLGNALTNFFLEKTNYYILGLSRSEVNFTSKSKKNQYKHLKIDLSNSEDISLSFKRLSSFFNGFKEIIFINNAGIIQPIGKISNLIPYTIINSLNVNLLSPIFIIKELLSMGKLVHVVNISSGAALRPIEGWSQYCTMKAGAKMFFDVYEKENKNSSVLHIDPGVIDTDMQKKIRKTSSEAFPLVENFINLKKDKKLQSPRQVAQNIFNTMQNQNLV